MGQCLTECTYLGNDHTLWQHYVIPTCDRVSSWLRTVRTLSGVAVTSRWLANTTQKLRLARLSNSLDRVVSNGCDVVRVAHRRCRQDDWMSKNQWRLSFSRAEIVLINSWMPVQEIVYVLHVKQKAQLPLRNRASATYFFVAKLLSIAVMTCSYVYHIQSLYVRWSG